MDDGLPIHARRAPVRPVSTEELAQRHRLTGKAFGGRIVRKQVRELVAEHGYAAWLQADDRNTGRDLMLKRIEDLPELPLGQIQHPEIVERPPAPQRSGRDHDPAPGCFQDLDRRFCGAGVEIIVERIGP